MKLHYLNSTKTAMGVFVFFFGLFIAYGAGQVFCQEVSSFVPPKDVKHAEELAKSFFQKKLDEPGWMLYAGEKRPEISTTKLIKENEKSFEFEIKLTPHIFPLNPASSKDKGSIFHILVSKATGRFAFENIGTDKYLISQYASFTRCAPSIIRLMNFLSGKALKESKLDFHCEAYGRFYYCLIPFLGNRYLARIPVDPIKTKLPEWALKNEEKFETGMAIRMFCNAFPVQIWPENFLKSQASRDPDVLEGISLYPEFAQSLGITPDPKIKGLKLEGWGRHGSMHAQDCGELSCAELLYQIGEKEGWLSSFNRIGMIDVMALGSPNPETFLVVGFDATSIHSSPIWGRTISRTFSMGGKEYPSMANLVVNGDVLATAVCRKFAGLRNLLKSAANSGKSEISSKALKIVSEF
ncbi:hypothetical protein HYY75_12495 [bacterium]|nr:hypothetical protein [bacterium]